MQAISAPTRSLEQRMEALAKGNSVRVYRAQLKPKLRSGEVKVVEALDDPMLETMKVFDLLMALPRVGRVKANRTLQVARISPSKTVGGLSPRQHTALLDALRGFPSVARATIGER